jgi:uroporphyrinogen decarboxylase
MNDRERYIQALTFGNPDKIPFGPGGPREKTLKRWRQEGLAEGVNHMDALYDILGFRPEPAQKPGPGLGVDFRMIPQFEEKVIEHKDGHYIVQDWMGAITEISDEYDYTYIRAARDFVTRKWHRFPVQNRQDFEEKIRWRYDPKAAGRFPEDFEERCAKNKDRDTLQGIHFNAPFWQMREWCGFEGLCTLMVDDPEFVDEMAEFWTNFVLETMRPILERVQLDRVGMSEDMAYKSFSMISPAMVRRFLKPAYLRWVPEIKKSGCPIIDMDSDGFIGELIPIWIESGINVCDPIEVAAGNDINEFRARFGKSIGYTGGIDKRAIAAGGETMRAELERVVPPMLKTGGFIPGCDHGVPHDISWPNFIEYSRLLAQMTGWL